MRLWGPPVNPWEIVGTGLRQTAADVNTFQKSRQDIFQEMVRRRMERTRAEREQAAEERAQDLALRQAQEESRRAEADRREQAEAERKRKAEEDKAARVSNWTAWAKSGTPQEIEPARPYFAPGMGPNGEEMAPPVMGPGKPPTVREMIDRARDDRVYEDAGVRAYLDDARFEEARENRPPPKAGGRSSQYDPEGLARNIEDLDGMIAETDRQFQELQASAPPNDAANFAQYRAWQNQVGRLQKQFAMLKRDRMRYQARTPPKGPSPRPEPKSLSSEKAREDLQRAGGDKDRARQMARTDGWAF